jgi:hypothetical protein
VKREGVKDVGSASRFTIHDSRTSRWVAEQPLVFQDRIPVRHSGQVITNGPGPPIPPGALPGQATDLLVVLMVALEQFF